MTADQLLVGLDPQQAEAVRTTASPLAIVAAAGSGKTMVLTRRIAHRVLTGTADARHVLALTFTREAATELRRRLRTFQQRDAIDAGTFHSVALRLLRDRALADHAPAPQVTNDRLALIRASLQELRLSVDPYAASTDIDWARARLIDPVDYSGVARLHRRRSAVPPARFAELTGVYEQLKRRRGVVDFDDLLTNLLQLMRTDRAWADGIRWRYRHLFVDEAQDLNPLQHAVLESIRDGRPDLCLVGDPRQAIYGWNGADHTLLSEVERSYPGITVVELHTNYRCSPQVVKAAAAALGAAGQHDAAQSNRPASHTVRSLAFADEHAEAKGVADLVSTLAVRHGPQQVAVLARTNDQAATLHRALLDRGVPAERAAGQSPLDLVLAEAFRCRNRELLAEWVERSFEGDDLHRRVAAEADRYLVSGEPGGFRSWIEQRSPFEDLEPGRTAERVTVLTFHAAKGREWEAVVVCGAEEGLVPHASSTGVAQLAEEARLFYVALTRAGDSLVVTRATTRSGKTVSPSRWLGAVEASTLADAPSTDDLRAAQAEVRTHVAAPDPMTPYREWRAAVARAAGVPVSAVCTDRTLRELMQRPPVDIAELAQRLGLTIGAAERLRPLPH